MLLHLTRGLDVVRLVHKPYGLMQHEAVTSDMDHLD